jgi:hypothetical protein
LKELQLVSGVLRKGDEGFILFLFFQNGSFWARRGGWGIPPLSKRGFS